MGELFVHPAFVGTVSVSEEKRRLHSSKSDDIYAQKGDMVFKSLTDEEEVITLAKYKEMISVEEKPKRKYNLDEMADAYAQAWVDNTVDESYIAIPQEFKTNKAL
ncbi:hypothetical protein [Bacillus infantis]|uniref:hypothetical protein n=1 Tax=Bacillus infantis TaxID=324767 RepID=UPI003CF1EB3B